MKPPRRPTLRRACFAAASALTLSLAAGCGDVHRAAPDAPDTAAGRGRLLLRQFGCGTCHVIPGVTAADGNVGPSLAGVARRIYLSGALPNSRDNMARFIQAPHDYDPQIVMPDMQVSSHQARDMVDYLYTLQ